MHKLKTTSCIAILSALVLGGSSTARGADILYNFSFNAINAAGVDLLADGTFSADPTKAVTGTTTGPLGEPYSTSIDSLALTVFNLGSAPFTDFSLTYGPANAVTAPVAWFSASNLTLGTADPLLTLSIPDSSGFLTTVISGAGTAFYQSSTFGSITGVPFVTGPQVTAVSFDASPTPEPASLGMLSVALFSGLMLFRREKSN